MPVSAFPWLGTMSWPWPGTYVLRMWLCCLPISLLASESRDNFHSLASSKQTQPPTPKKPRPPRLRRRLRLRQADTTSVTLPLQLTYNRPSSHPHPSCAPSGRERRTRQDGVPAEVLPQKCPAIGQRTVLPLSKTLVCHGCCLGCPGSTLKPRPLLCFPIVGRVSADR